MQTYDAIIVGGGPAGSTCARVLTGGGARVLVLDRATFPRVKLCAGWLSAPIWDALGIAPAEYRAAPECDLWEWNTCHVYFRGRYVPVRAHGYFIRRYQFDAYLLSRAGCEVRQGVSVKAIERQGDGWSVQAGDETLHARHVIGAGGTHCPVARAVFAPKRRAPVGVQEREFQADPAAVARARVGADGEPELLLHDDFRGYSWNVPKTDWLNVGCGTIAAREVRAAWEQARTFFTERGHVPVAATAALDKVKGYSYYLYDPANVDDCEQGGALLVGDALGLAQPLTAEGILPAVLSGRMAAEALLAGDPARYRPALRAHPILRDYELLYRLREAGSSVKHSLGGAPAQGKAGKGLPAPLARALGDAARAPSEVAAARAFAWLFSGKRLPAGGMVSRLWDTLASGQARAAS